MPSGHNPAQFTKSLKSDVGGSTQHTIPVFTAVPLNLSLNENVSGFGEGNAVALGAVTATGTPRYTLTAVLNDSRSSDVSADFTISASGAITYIGTGLDAEAATQVNITVFAANGSGRVARDITVTINDLNDEAPELFFIESGAMPTDGEGIDNVAAQNLLTTFVKSDKGDDGDVSNDPPGSRDDELAEGDTVSFTLTGDDAAYFRITDDYGSVGWAGADALKTLLGAGGGGRGHRPQPLCLQPAGRYRRPG